VTACTRGEETIIVDEIFVGWIPQARLPGHLRY